MTYRRNRRGCTRDGVSPPRGQFWGTGYALDGTTGVTRLTTLMRPSSTIPTSVSVALAVFLVATASPAEKAPRLKMNQELAKSGFDADAVGSLCIKSSGARLKFLFRA